MSEPESLIPDLLGDVLVTKQRVAYHQIQEAIRQGKNMLSLDVSAVDGMFDKIAHLRRRELVAEQDAKQLREKVALLEQQAESAAEIIVGLAKLLSAARQSAKERQG